MKIALLGAFPVYEYAEQLGIHPKAVQRVTSWNENLAKALSRISDLEVHVITSTKLIRKTRTLHQNNIHVTFFVSPPKANLLTGFQYSRFAIHRILQDIKPDIVHGIGTEHIWPYIAVTSCFPSVVTIHGVMSEIVRKIPTPWLSRKRFFALLERWVVRRAKHLISINPYVQQILTGNPRLRIYHVENPLSERFFKVQTYPGRSKRILFVGAVQQGKDILGLVKAFSCLVSECANVELVIVGPILEPSYYQKVKIFVQQTRLNNKIIFKGFLLPDELIVEYRNAGMLVLPSLQETAPMCVAEAMACGLPVVATRVGGVEYMVQHGRTGFLVEPQRPYTLAKAILKLLRCPELRNHMGKEARKVARGRFHPDIVARKTVKVYEEVIACTG